MIGIPAFSSMKADFWMSMTRSTGLPTMVGWRGMMRSPSVAGLIRAHQARQVAPAGDGGKDDDGHGDKGDCGHCHCRRVTVPERVEDLQRHRGIGRGRDEEHD